MLQIEELQARLRASKQPESLLGEIRNATNRAASTDSWATDDYRARWLALLGEAFSLSRRPIEAARVWQESLRAKWSSAVIHCWVGELRRCLKLPQRIAKPLEKATKEGPVSPTQQHHATLLLCDELLRLSRATSPVELCEVGLRFVASVIPTSPEIHTELGVFLGKLNLSRAACEAFRRALALSPDSTQYLNNMASGLDSAGQHEEALGYALKAVNQDAAPIFLLNTSTILNHLHRFDDAADYATRTLDIDPKNAFAWVNKGKALYELQRESEAEACFLKALELAPEYTEALNNLAVLASQRGEIAAAVAQFDRALSINPFDPILHSSRIMLKQYSGNYSEDERFADHVAFGQACTASIRPLGCETAVKREPGAPLCIGFVSGDLRKHPVGYFLQSILPELGQRTRLVAYHTQPNIDEFTNNLRPHFSVWRQVNGMDDLNLAQLVRRDRIDVLIDLSGHTKNHRLTLFAYRPAQAQATWMGYFATTGLADMDFVIADPVVLRNDNAVHFLEKPARLPNCYLCFSAPDFECPITTNTEQPTATFGCFNNFMKLSDAVLSVWARILTVCPSATLLIKTMRMERDEVRMPLVDRLCARGVRPEQLLIEPGGTRAEMLASYNRVQLALDTFPYPGGTTTSESLWMGVPVLHKAGKTFLGRVGESILRAVGLPEWVMVDEDAYIERAIQVASGNYPLPDRQSLRMQMKNSPFMDAPRFANDFVELMERCWQEKSLMESQENG